MPEANIPTPIDVLKQFRVIFNTIKQHFQQTENSISGAQLWGLALIARQPGLRISDLASMMGTHPSTCSNLVHKLCRQQFVSKERYSSTDQRVVRLYPTEEGLRILNKAPSSLEALLPSALNQLPEQDLVLLYSLLQNLITLMQPHDAIECAAIPAMYGEMKKTLAASAPELKREAPAANAALAEFITLAPPRCLKDAAS